MNIFTILVLSGAIIYFLFIRNKKNQKNVPPGPWGLPFFGNMFQISGNQTQAFDDLARKYGDIYSLKLGPLKCVVLNEPKLIREALSEPEFSGRPDILAFNNFSGGKIGVIASDGEHWEQQRRFTLRHLRDFGFGKNYMEELIMEEVKEVIDWFKREEGTSVSVKGKLGLAVLNSLWMIMTGNRYKQDDPELTKLQRAGTEGFTELSKNPFAFFMNWLLVWAPKLTGWDKMIEITDKLQSFFKGTINEHKKSRNKDNPRDFVDSYLNEIEKTVDPRSSFYKDMGEKALLATIGDLYGAGSDTTSNTITWTILYLIWDSRVQDKLQEEIDRVIGKNRLPTLSDRTKMPYFEATLSEVLRMSSLVPQGLFHQAMKTTKLRDWVIPKDTLIFPNQHFVHYDPRIWGDPEKFKPERFLTPDGAFKKNDSVIAFSVGKRQCLGESLARDELFLFLTTIFQRFRISKDPKNPDLSIEPLLGFISAAKPFTCVMKDRLV